MTTVHLFGIRHHGPGSARSVWRALEDVRPTAVLVELPADCQPALGWVGSDGLVPPVALLGYVPDRPGRAAFLPFAEFSPEWQACRWATEHGATLTAIDLPLRNMLAGGDGEAVTQMRRRRAMTASWRWPTTRWATHWLHWPWPRATPTPNGGGRTWWSTVVRGWRPSPPLPRR